MCYLFTGMNVKVRDDVMTSKQPLVSTCLDESGQLLMLSVSPVFSGEISTRLLASRPILWPMEWQIFLPVRTRCFFESGVL